MNLLWYLLVAKWMHNSKSKLWMISYHMAEQLGEDYVNLYKFIYARSMNSKILYSTHLNVTVSFIRFIGIEKVEETLCQ